MIKDLRPFLAAAVTGLAFAFTPAPASAQGMIDCALDVNAARPECQGRGKGGIVAPGTPSATPQNRAATTAAGGQGLIDCMLDVNQARPECQGRGNTGLVAPGTTPNGVTATGSVPAAGTAGNRNLVDCMLDANQARPECQGRGNTGLVAPGTAPANR